MDTMTETYNGWKNRETWAFNLHWQNDQGFYNLVREYAAGLLAEMGEGVTNYALGERVAEYVESEIPELAPGLWELMRTDVGSFWRVDPEETGACVRESLDADPA